jgi:phosphohistidine phosphatase
MKTLLLMRHGKSSWKDESLEDRERPLRKRGRKDSKRIAKVLIDNNLMPDLILSSTAVRAKETVGIIVETLCYQGRIVFSDGLYMSEPQDFIDMLKAVDDEIETVMIVAHNPGLEAYLQIIDGEVESLPTAGLGYLAFAVDSWAEVSLETTGDLIGIWKPKELKEKE